MPNWCNNYVSLSGPQEKIDELIVELKKSALPDQTYEIFNKLLPRPADQEENWYDWNINNWGTKWDVNIDSYDVVDENTVTLSFDSAWSPPTNLYQSLEEQGWVVDAFYNEEGMAFCGHYSDGEDDYYEYANLTADEIQEQIPSDIDDMFCISEYRRDWEEQQIELGADEEDS